MGDRSDLEELAERCLDVWQDHLRALASDPELMRTMAAAATAITGGPQSGERRTAEPKAGEPPAAQDVTAAWFAWPMAFMQAALAAAAGEGREKDERDPAQSQEAPAGATAAAVPLERGKPDLGQLARRLAALEERVAALERAAGETDGGARGRPSRPAK